MNYRRLSNALSQRAPYVAIAVGSVLLMTALWTTTEPSGLIEFSRIAPPLAPIHFKHTPAGLHGLKDWAGEWAFKELGAAYVVTVDSRRERVNDQLQLLGLEATIFEAYEKPESAKDWNALASLGEFSKPALETLSAGELAVSLSHRAVLEVFLSDPNAVSVLIFEDDFEANGGALGLRLQASLRYLPDDWDLLFLGRCHDHCENDRHLGADLYRITAPVCLHAYTVTRKAAIKILEAARECTGSQCAIDQIVRSLIAGGKGLRAFAVSPRLFGQAAELRGNASLVLPNEHDIHTRPWLTDTGHQLRVNERTDSRLPECAKNHDRDLESIVSPGGVPKVYRKLKPKEKRARTGLGTMG